MSSNFEDLEEDDNELIPTTEVITEPCAHCGKLDAFVERADFASAYVFCNSCSAKGPVACQESDSEEEPGANDAIRQWNRRSPSPPSTGLSEDAERFRLLARHYMKALGEIVIEDDRDAAQLIACEALGSNPSPQAAGTTDLFKALSRLTDNRHSDGVSSLVSPEDRGAIISGCYDLMVASRQAPAPHLEGSQALLDVYAERRRQVEAEGWTPAHDDQHTDASMALAAGSYCESAARPTILTKKPGSAFAVPKLWPQSWSRDWWKPKSPREDLVRAGALIIAEIERLDRAATSEGSDAD